MELQLDFSAAFQEALNMVTGWIEGLVGNLPKIVAALVVLLVAYAIARVARRLIRRVLDRLSDYPDVNRVLAWFAYAAVIFAGLFVALGILDLNKTVTSLLAGAGIAGLAIGFALQSIAENFVSGISLSIRRQFTDGDIVETNDFTGVIERVDMRTTVLRTFTGERIMIPNSAVYKSPLINFSTYGTRRVDVPVGVAYGDDLERAKRVAIEAVEGVEHRDEDRPVELFYEEFGASSVNFKVRFWIPFREQKDYVRARSDAIMRIKRAFDENDITIPFPIRTLDFGVVGGVPLSDELAATPGAGGR